MAEVSIITPTYNSARFIKETVESVLNQTYQNWEYIIVDDGSTDNTKEVLEPYMDRITYIWQENARQAKARNRAYAVSNGKYIAIIDADDLWEPTKLEKQMAYMENESKVGLVYTDRQDIDEAGNFLINNQSVPDITEEPLRHQLLGNYTPFSSFLIRREAIGDDPLHDERFTHSGDRYLTIRIALQGWKFAYVKEKLLLYRRHHKQQSVSRHNLENILGEILTILEEISVDSRLPSHYKPLIKEFYATAYMHQAWHIIKNGAKTDYIHIIDYIWKSFRHSRKPFMNKLRQEVTNLLR